MLCFQTASPKPHDLLFFYFVTIVEIACVSEPWFTLRPVDREVVRRCVDKVNAVMEPMHESFW